MASKTIKRLNGGVGKYLYTFLADLVADIDEIPTTIAIGSEIICLENSKKYILSPQREWEEV